MIIRCGRASVLAALAVLATSAAHAAIPIQPETGPHAGCSPPGHGACRVTAGTWFGTSGNDSVWVWIDAAGTSVDSARVVVNGGNCSRAPRLELVRRWIPGRRLDGGHLPQCGIEETLPCTPPDVMGFAFALRFPTSTCGLADLTLRDPAGRTFCPAPCPSLDDVWVAVRSGSWTRLKRLYLD
jgi:hypothetical protein